MTDRPLSAAPLRGAFTLTELLVFLFIFAALAGGLWFAAGAFGLRPGLASRWGTGAETAAAEPPKQTPREKVSTSLAELDKKSADASAKRLTSVRDFFGRARRGARPFAEDALSWSGKWALVKESVGLSEEDGHARFLQDAFARRVFTANDLKAALEGAVKGYLSDLEAMENEWLVRLRADLADGELGRDAKLPHLASDERFRAEYARVAAEVMPLLSEDFKAEVGRQAVSLVAGEIATVVVIRVGSAVAAELGVSAGILGTGAASTVATLGVGLVVGVVVDHLLGLLLKELGYDPQKEVAGKTADSVRRLEGLLLDGPKGLAAEVKKLHEARAKLRQKVARKLLHAEGGQ